ncbi:MAG: aminotransferase class IV [bacterium]
MIAWTDGRIIPADHLSIPVGDAGFVLGATVTEQLRTFRGRLFLTGEHACRMAGSLSIAGIDLPMPLAEVFEAASEVAARNQALLEPDDALGVCVVATPGDLPAQRGGLAGRPRVLVHSFHLAFRLWADAYAAGIPLVGVSVRQVPDDCWPIELKCRSRMHYHLADREASARIPGGRAVLCHADGRVSETSTANVVAAIGGRLVTPPPSDALPGVSLGHVRRLAIEEGIPWEDRPLSLDECGEADELLLTSTPSCLLPATSLDGRPIGGGRPGPMFGRLLEAWSRGVGLDIRRQAESMVGGPGA